MTVDDRMSYYQRTEYLCFQRWYRLSSITLYEFVEMMNCIMLYV
jgi:hypothetical protein